MADKKEKVALMPNVSFSKSRLEMNCRTIKPFLVYFESKYGKEELKKFIHNTGMPLEYLENENNWLTFSYYTSLFDKLVEYAGNSDALFEAGTCAAKIESYGSLHFILRVLSNPALTYGNIIRFNHNLSRAAELSLLELKKNKAIIKVHYLDEFVQTVNNCRYLQGNYASIPTVWGLPLAKVNHSKCQARGDDSCVYEITWVNKPSQLFGYLGSLTGAFIAWIAYSISGKLYFSGSAEDMLFLAALLLSGYLIGRAMDYKNIAKEGAELYEGQNTALLNSVREIEELNRDLQKKVEARTEELSMANKKLEKAYKDLKDNEVLLVQSEKMASLGRLIAGIAHEVNTPAGVIRSSISFVLANMERIFFDIVNIDKFNFNEKDKAFYLEIIKKTAANTLTRNGMSLKEEENQAKQIREKANELNLHLPAGAERVLAEFHLKDELAGMADLLSRTDAKLLLKTLQDIGRYFINLRSVDIGTERIIELVKALKAYSRLDQSKVEEVDIYEGINTSLTILNNELRGGIEVIKNFSDLPKITCYVNELNQVWTNIILNACEAMKGKGKIVIETYRKDDMAAVKITDDGPGIPKEISGKIFEPFFTTKAKGTGMGLGICQQIVEKHNGRINVESVPGKTSFEVVLPIKAALAKESLKQVEEAKRV
ncbi:MAG: HAMP domain-containing sensor histidine kinase [Candidatus Omnitrophota bacterium]